MIAKIKHINDAVKAFFADEVQSEKFLVVSRAGWSISIL